MFKKIIFLLVILISSNTFLNAQEKGNASGFFIDHTNQFINGYFDFTYSPKKAVSCELTIGEDYTPGYYYDLQKNKIKGKLKYNQNNTFFRFTTTTDEWSEKIKPDECLGYVIGNDSFTVITDFNVERLIGAISNKGPEFAEVIATIDDLTFYQHTRVGSNTIVYTVMVRKGVDGELESFSQTPEKFKVSALRYFGKVPFLKTQIENQAFTSEDLLYLIKYLEYYGKYGRGEKVYYTESWEETTIPSRVAYYATIENTGKAKWIFKYFSKDSIPIYEGRYYNLSPMKKDGVFTFFYPNGAVRKTVL